MSMVESCAAFGADGGSPAMCRLMKSRSLSVKPQSPVMSPYTYELDAARHAWSSHASQLSSHRGRRAGAARVRGSGSGGAPCDSRRPLVATTSVPTPATMSRFLAPRSALSLVSVSTT